MITLLEYINMNKSSKQHLAYAVANDSDDVLYNAIHKWAYPEGKCNKININHEEGKLIDELSIYIKNGSELEKYLNKIGFKKIMDEDDESLWSSKEPNIIGELVFMLKNKYKSLMNRKIKVM